MSVITASVGKKGVNRTADVVTIQRLLRDNGYFPINPKKVNHAVCRSAIKAFQKTFMASPTELIEPDSDSEKLLIALNPGAAAIGSFPGWTEFVSGGEVTRAVLLTSVAPAVVSALASRSAYYPTKPGFSALSLQETIQHFGDFDFTDVAGSDNIEINNPNSKYKIESFVIPQLATIPNSSGKPPDGGRVRCHQLAGARFQKLFAEWEKAGLLNRINDFSGPYNARYKREVVHDGQKSSLSYHSWGTAIDLNVDQNKLNRRPARLGEYGTLLELVPIANALGFYWGGHFSTRLDGMHFEIAIL